MPKFGVYFIPEGNDVNDKFFKLGSKVLGYDIINCQKIDGFKEFKINSEWLEYCVEYGFHLTIGDAIYFDCDLEKIVTECYEILATLDPQKKFKLVPKNGVDFVDYHGVNRDILLINYEANDYLKIFHTLIVSCVHTLGNGSLYNQRKSNNLNEYSENTFLDKRVDKFYTYTGLDNYCPHFTLLNPFRTSDPERGRVKAILNDAFQEFKGLSFIVDKIAIVYQDKDNSPFKIYKILSR